MKSDFKSNHSQKGLKGLKGKKILITGGPTWVPIDDMRIISNLSTGHLAQTLALNLSRQGAKVVLLEGPVAKRLFTKKIKVIPFTFFDELQSVLNTELKKKYDVVIHAAAVSDYKLKKPFRSKLSSSLSELKLELVPAQKIINTIKRASPGSLLVGFKLETKIDEASAIAKTKSLFNKAKCDLVIANSLSNGNYTGYILDKSGKVLANAGSREAMSKTLTEILKKI